MKFKWMIDTRYIVTTLLILFTTITLQAQWQISQYVDTGDKNVSNGLYMNTAVLASFQANKFNVNAGTQFAVFGGNTNIGGNTNTLSGINIKVSHGFSIKDFPLEIQGLFLYTPFSDVVHESNWGLLVNVELNHINVKLGSNFRKYKITREAADIYHITSDRSLHENWNLMYHVGYDLKAIENEWNVGISITNMDHFLINQETNPMLNLRGSYAISLPLTLYIETWYKSAGALNISANYFGFFLRTGIIWKIKP